MLVKELLEDLKKRDSNDEVVVQVIAVTGEPIEDGDILYIDGDVGITFNVRVMKLILTAHAYED